MRITSLEVDGFGVWTGLKLENLSDGLNVLYGPNEAGKSTLMQFVRSVLYGFSPERRRYLPPVRGGEPGGSVDVVGPNGSFTVSRHQDQENPNGRELVALEAADGTRQGEHLLKVLLCEVDEPVFNNVFAVGLRELQELGTLSDTEAAAQLYNLSVGLDRVSIVDVVRELRTSRNRLLDPNGEPCRVTQLMAQREKLRTEIEESATATGRYARLAAQHRQLDRQAARLDEQNNHLQRQLQTIEIALNVRQRWYECAGLDKQLAAAGPAESMPQGAIGQLDAVNSRLSKYERQVAQWKTERSKIRSEAAGLNVNRALWRLAPRIEAIQEQTDWIASLQKQVGVLEGEIADLEGQIGAERQRLGLKDGVAVDELPRMSSRVISVLRPAAKEMARRRQRLQETQAEVDTARHTAQAATERVDAALGSTGHTDLAESIQIVSEDVAQLRRRIQLDDRQEEMQRYRVDLDEQSRRLVERQVMPVWVLVGLGVVFAVGVLMLMAGLFMSSSITGALGWPMAILGLAGTVTAVAAKFTLEKSNARQMEACHRQNSVLESQIKQVERERSEFDSENRGGGPLATRLEVAERELAELEKLVPMDAQRNAAGQEAENVVQRLRQAQHAADAAQDRWQQALTSIGLPRKLSPKQVKSLLARRNQIGEIKRNLDSRYEEFQQRSRELESITARISQLAGEAELTVYGDDPIEQLRGLEVQLKDQQAKVKQRQELRGTWRQLGRRMSKYDVEITRLTHRRKKLLGTVGVESEDEFRRLAEQLALVADIRRKRDAVNREIDAALGGNCTREAVDKVLADAEPGSLEKRRGEFQKQLQETGTQVRSQLEKRGELSQQLKTMASDRSMAARQIELATVEARLEEAIHQWRKLAVTSRILDRIRNSYEKDRQPETLQEASGYLQSLTQDRYVRVWTPLGEDVLLVDDAHGNSLPAEVLSRGTREQLFLALRLALAADYGRRGVQLPIVLDDVLVNFDGQRAKAAARVLRDFAAAGHQMLVFTCHEHITKLFTTLKVTVLELPNNAELGVSAKAPQKAVRKARKPKPVPVADIPEEKEEEIPALEEEVFVEEELFEEQLDDVDEVAPWEEEAEEEPVDEVEEEDYEEDEYEEDEYEEDDDEEDVEAEYEEEEPEEEDSTKDDWDDQYEDQYDDPDEDRDDAQAA